MTNRKLPNDQTLYQLYWNNELSLKEIANRYDVTKGAVYQRMVNAGIRRRDALKAQEIALKKSGKWHNFDRNIMDNWSIASTYFMGIYIAGGTINNNTLFIYFRNWQYDLAIGVQHIITSSKLPEKWESGYRLIYSSTQLVSKLNEIEDKLRSDLDVIPENYRGMFVTGFLNRAALYQTDEKMVFSYEPIMEQFLDKYDIVSNNFVIDVEVVAPYIHKKNRSNIPERK